MINPLWYLLALFWGAGFISGEVFLIALSGLAAILLGFLSAGKPSPLELRRDTATTDQPPPTD